LVNDEERSDSEFPGQKHHHTHGKGGDAQGDQLLAGLAGRADTTEHAAAVVRVRTGPLAERTGLGAALRAGTPADPTTHDRKTARCNSGRLFFGSSGISGFLI